MNYSHILPSPALRAFVRCYWWLDSTTSKPLEYTILPDGYFDMICSFQNYNQDCLSLSGLWTKEVEVTIPPNSQLFGIQFRLLALDYILQHNLAEFINDLKPLDYNF